MITVLIQTYNEEKNIVDCILSAKLLTNDIIVVDTQSIDKTTNIANELGAKVFSFPNSTYVEPARNFGINKISDGWIFILDADERITKELAVKLKKIITKTPSDVTHYKIMRKNVFAGKVWLKYGGWWPDSQLRFFDKNAFIEWPKEIHSTPKFKGDVGIIHEPFLHYFHGDFTSMVQKTLIYEGIESELLFNAGKNVTIITFFRKFLAELYRRLIKNKGYKDGHVGILESIYQAFSKTITYFLLYEKKKTSTL